MSLIILILFTINLNQAEFIGTCIGDQNICHQEPCTIDPIQCHENQQCMDANCRWSDYDELEIAYAAQVKKQIEDFQAKEEQKKLDEHAQIPQYPQQQPVTPHHCVFTAAWAALHNIGVDVSDWTKKSWNEKAQQIDDIFQKTEAWQMVNKNKEWWLNRHKKQLKKQGISDHDIEARSTIASVEGAKKEFKQIIEYNKQVDQGKGKSVFNYKKKEKKHVPFGGKEPKMKGSYQQMHQTEQKLSDKSLFTMFSSNPKQIVHGIGFFSNHFLYLMLRTKGYGLGTPTTPQDIQHKGDWNYRDLDFRINPMIRNGDITDITYWDKILNGKIKFHNSKGDEKPALAIIFDLNSEPWDKRGFDALDHNTIVVKWKENDHWYYLDSNSQWIRDWMTFKPDGYPNIPITDMYPDFDPGSDKYHISQKVINDDTVDSDKKTKGCPLGYLATPSLDLGSESEDVADFIQQKTDSRPSGYWVKRWKITDFKTVFGGGFNGQSFVEKKPENPRFGAARYYRVIVKEDEPLSFTDIIKWFERYRDNHETSPWGFQEKYMAKARSLGEDNIYHWNEQLENALDEDTDDVQTADHGSQQNEYFEIKPFSGLLLTVEIALFASVTSVICCILGGIFGYRYDSNYCVNN